MKLLDLYKGVNFLHYFIAKVASYNDIHHHSSN